MLFGFFQRVLFDLGLVELCLLFIIIAFFLGIASLNVFDLVSQVINPGVDFGMFGLQL